ncbi:MAG: GrpB family protein [Phenylobacterium sp.]|nr:GrpB family protein [Phenylobacterium sp.]
MRRPIICVSPGWSGRDDRTPSGRRLRRPHDCSREEGLLEIGQILGSYQGKFAVIGGAVPWLLLGAKPILDIMLGVNDRREIPKVRRSLEALGFHRASSTLWVIWTEIRELPYGPAPLRRLHHRPDRWQHLTTCQTSRNLLAPKGASTDGKRTSPTLPGWPGESIRTARRSPVTR